MTTVKERVVTGLEDLVDAIPAPRKSNEAKSYQEIFIWQEIEALADDKLKKAWKAAQETVIEADVEMRELGEGDHIVCEAGNFSCVAKVAKPGKRFDAEMFVELAAKELKVKPAKIIELMEKARKDTAAPLTKRILEA